MAYIALSIDIDESTESLALIFNSKQLGKGAKPYNFILYKPWVVALGS